MKALILNSGLGSRMGEITKTHPKCMTEIYENETIVSRQLKLLNKIGIKEVVMTTGPFVDNLINYCKSLNIDMNYSFVNNPIYKETNYIYSIYCAKNYLNDDIIMMHGDLVYEESVLKDIVNNEKSSMVVTSTLPLPEKDFKAVIQNNKIKKIGIEYFDNAITAQPLYKIKKEDWCIWLNSIIDFCENNQRLCYAENAFNEVSDKCHLYGFDIKDRLCMEIDNKNDLEIVKNKVKELKK